MSFFYNIKTENVSLDFSYLNQDLKFYMKREDLIHPIISGNKFRKLKYNLKEFKKNKNSILITFGGAFSNHLLAVAYLGKVERIETLAIVRGEELRNSKLNSTLKKCSDFGMNFDFISREKYRKRNTNEYILELKNKYKNSYIVPEGGTNISGIKGCEEILTEYDKEFFDVVCVPVGSGGTFSGLINSSLSDQKILGFSALNNSNIKEVINRFVKKNNWKIFDDSCFGGYAKFNNELINFINQFYKNHNIKLDPIYNAKMIFNIIDLINKNKWSFGKNILIINTGGTQSSIGINELLKKKGCETINY
ncbi:MAG: 1-aminocyclopropane-1-carboxylate deaminase/D-cysteine desulfhydrase [Flavobacteriales bacterium]